MSNEVAEDMKDWPRDLIAIKWADTLSAGEQSVLLTSSLRRLQQAINIALATPAPVPVEQREVGFADVFTPPANNEER